MTIIQYMSKIGPTMFLLKVWLISEALISGRCNNGVFILSKSMHSEICEQLELDTEDTRNQPAVGDECPL
jgi:hypothetical protein